MKRTTHFWLCDLEDNVRVCPVTDRTDFHQHSRVPLPPPTAKYFCLAFPNLVSLGTTNQRAKFIPQTVSSWMVEEKFTKSQPGSDENYKYDVFGSS